MLYIKKYILFAIIGICLAENSFIPKLEGKFHDNQSILNKEFGNNLSGLTMDHQFSLMTSSSQLGQISSGIYSNTLKYNFSEKLNLNSKFHIINSNKQFYSKNQIVDFRYELGVKYKITDNSQIFLKISNLGIPTNNSHYLFQDSNW